jgi:hypothetical protein
MNGRDWTVWALALVSGVLWLISFSWQAVADEGGYSELLFPSRADLKTYRFDPAPVLIQVGSEVLSFEIPIPGKNWQRLEQMNIDTDIRLLAGFVHPQGPDKGLIQVLAFSPESEINAHDWLLWLIETEGMKKIAGREDITDSRGPVIDVLSISETARGSGDVPMMMRTGIYRNGKDFILVRCTASAESFVDRAHYFGLAVHRFLIHDRKMTQYIGSWDEYCLGNFCFLGPVPGPHKAEPEKELIHERYYKLGPEGRQTGILNIRVIAAPLAGKTPAKDRINNILYSMVEQSGMTFEEELVAFKGEHQNLEGTTYYARNRGADSAGRALEFFALSWENEDEAVFIFMLTDARSLDSAAWMVNKRIFEIVSRSFRFK